jgi:hypothetical protein
MRCVDLAQTWTELHGWLDRAGIMVLPPLVADGPLVRLDDAAAVEPVCPRDPTAAIRRLQSVIELFAVPAVYVGQRSWARTPGGTPEPAELTSLTVRVLAVGVIHELRLVAAWYDDLTEPALGTGGDERVRAW